MTVEAVSVVPLGLNRSSLVRRPVNHRGGPGGVKINDLHFGHFASEAIADAADCFDHSAEFAEFLSQ